MEQLRLRRAVYTGTLALGVALSQAVHEELKHHPAAISPGVGAKFKFPRFERLADNAGRRLQSDADRVRRPQRADGAVAEGDVPGSRTSSTVRCGMTIGSCVHSRERHGHVIIGYRDPRGSRHGVPSGRGRRSDRQIRKASRSLEHGVDRRREAPLLWCNSLLGVSKGVANRVA